MKKLLLLIFIFNGFVALGQILKVDKGRIDADSARFFLGSINMDFNINNRSATADQEITFKGLNAKADLVYLSEKNAYILINNINYFTSTGGPLISTGYAHFRVNYLRKKKLSYENFVQIQYDDGRNMPMRRLLGGGIRLNMRSTTASTFYIGTGLMFEYEEWKSNELNKLITKEIWKNSTYLGFKATVNEYVKFNGIVYFQGGLDTDSDLYRSRYSGDISLSVTLTNNLSFMTTFTSQYEERPIININNWVYSLTNGLIWNF